MAFWQVAATPLEVIDQYEDLSMHKAGSSDESMLLTLTWHFC